MDRCTCCQKWYRLPTWKRCEVCTTAHCRADQPCKLAAKEIPYASLPPLIADLLYAYATNKRAVLGEFSGEEADLANLDLECADYVTDLRRLLPDVPVEFWSLPEPGKW